MEYYNTTGEHITSTAGEQNININNEVETETTTMLPWLFSDDDSLDLSNFIEASSENTHPLKVKIINDPTWHPLTFQTAAAYITINGNEEVCGSSYSDSDTSYMAGIASGCGLVGGAWDGLAEEARWLTEIEEFLVNGSTGGDDMLAL